MHVFPARFVLALLALIAAGCILENDESDADSNGPAIEPGKTVVVYQTFRPDTQRAQLYAAASDGSAVHLLAPDRLSSATIEAYALSPTGIYVAYRASAGGTEPERLYIANVYTGEITEITRRVGGPLGAGTFVWSPIGTHLAYTGGDVASSAGWLYLYDLPADRSLRVSPGETAAHNLSTLAATPDLLRWSPNGAALAYRSDYGTAELNAIAPDGSGYRRLSALPTSDTVVHDVVEWAPDSRRIFYVAEQDTPGAPELFVTNFDGSGNLQLSPAFPAGGEVQSAYWSPDSRFVAMAIAQDALGAQIRLWGSAADGSHAWDIASNIGANGAVDPAVIEWSPDASHIAYLADANGDGLSEFYSAAVPSGDLYLLSPASPGTSPEASLAWDPQSTRLAFTQDTNTPGRFVLYTSDATGSVRTGISGLPTADASVRDFVWTPAGNPLGGALAYRVVTANNIALRVFETASNATTELTRFSRAPILIRPEWLPRSAQLAFVGDVYTPDVAELFISDPAGPIRTISHRM
ncbi:MAG: hypothetical protein WCZ87_10905, partial [Thiohalobacteraceae bacterium]